MTICLLQRDWVNILAVHVSCCWRMSSHTQSPVLPASALSFLLFCASTLNTFLLVSRRECKESEEKEEHCNTIRLIWAQKGYQCIVCPHPLYHRLPQPTLSNPFFCKQCRRTEETATPNATLPTLFCVLVSSLFSCLTLHILSSPILLLFYSLFSPSLIFLGFFLFHWSTPVSASSFLL